MLEFDSISVSSYEADTLAQKLTEKSTAGWDVVSIVSAGSAVTAYLSREAGSAAAEPEAATTPDATESAVEDFGGEEVGPLGDADLAAAGAGAADAFGESTEAPVEAVWSPAPEAVDTPSSSDTSSSSDSGTSASSWPETERIDTPAATEPEPSSFDSGTSTPSLADDVAALASQITDDDAPDTSEPAGWATSSDAGTAEPTLPGAGATGYEAAEAAQEEPAQEAAAEPAQETQQATGAAAPAGWYADPSGRFELRYWDGGQWTEHVSRAGQQYTDPPVA